MMIANRSLAWLGLRVASACCALALGVTFITARASNTIVQAVTAGAQSAVVADLTLSPVAYSQADQSSAGVLALTMDDSSGTGSGWSVTIQSSAFAYSGAYGGTSIPAANFAITAANAPTLTSGQALDATGGPLVPPTGAVGSLDAARTVLQASNSFGQGSYAQTLDVQLTVPGMSRVGTYTGTLTVTVGAAP